jgi:hypothetical protein
VDRVAQVGILQVIQPILDAGFSELSFGYRPGRDRLHAFASAEQLARATDRWVWLTEDIQDAFTRVHLESLYEILFERLPNEQLVNLIRMATSFQRDRGLIQGGPLSPLLLNLYLDEQLDRPWQTIHPGAPLLRVADDLLVLSVSREEAQACYDALASLLTPVGMLLKGRPQTAICRMADGEPTSWLGFELRFTEGGVEYSLTDRLWRQLSDELALAHEHRRAPIWALQVVWGWLNQLGPAVPGLDVAEIHRELRDRLEEEGLECPTESEVGTVLSRAYQRWRSTCERMDCA